MGTIAFAISGAMEAVRHKMDVFGVAMMGVVAATGGGIIRDLIIGAVPPVVFRHPEHAVLALCVALAVFVLLHSWHKKSGGIHHIAHIFERIYFLSDTLGLGVFTVVGIEAAGEAGGALLLFVGVVTGVGGGVLRDVLAGTVPRIFRKNVYALATMAGAAANILLAKFLPAQLAMLIGFSMIVVIRLLAAHFKWNLPRIE